MRWDSDPVCPSPVKPAAAVRLVCCPKVAEQREADNRRLPARCRKLFIAWKYDACHHRKANLLINCENKRRRLSDSPNCDKLDFVFYDSFFCFILLLCNCSASAEIRRAVQAALAEDIGSGDVTTLATVPETATAKAVLRAREPLVVAGLDFAEAAFRELSTAVKIERLAQDGRHVKAGENC